MWTKLVRFIHPPTTSRCFFSRQHVVICARWRCQSLLQCTRVRKQCVANLGSRSVWRWIRFRSWIHSMEHVAAAVCPHWHRPRGLQGPKNSNRLGANRTNAGRASASIDPSDSTTQTWREAISVPQTVCVLLGSRQLKRHTVWTLNKQSPRLFSPYRVSEAQSKICSGFSFTAVFLVAKISRANQIVAGVNNTDTFLGQKYVDRCDWAASWNQSHGFTVD